MNDLNYNAGMSSYQFVNSLASCYGNQAPGRTGTPVDQAGHPGLPSSGADYYNPNAAASAYPNTCYSPPQVSHHYPQHPYATPASGAHMQPQTMIDYTQLHPQRLGSTASHMHPNPSPGALSPNLMSTPPTQATAASCKFADSTSTTGVASPQDLSTSSGPGRTSPGFGNVGQNASGTSTKLGLTTPIASPVEHKANINQNISSPASSTSSNDSNDANNSSSNNTKNSKSAGGSGANPPQIYPWMKRVHLGQSKLLFSCF